MNNQALYQQADAILQRLLRSATKMSDAKLNAIPSKITGNINPFLRDIEQNKSLVAVIVTSAVKKLISPEQDIRRHMAKFDGGYSARSLDTKVTTPFFSKHFPRYANKETAFLTKATRADIVWELPNTLPLRNSKLNLQFLELVKQIQNRSINIERAIIYILAHLKKLSEQGEIYSSDALKASDVLGVINISTILDMLSEHFGAHLGSRLPVIAIHAIYEQMIKTINIYAETKLCPLNVHTSADKHGYGDVEVINNDGSPFEIVEIKHGIAIDQNLIRDVAKKSNNTSIKKYYILTTYSGSFVNNEEENRIKLLVRKIKKDTGIEIIPNGIIQSIKYYLRFVNDYNQYINAYTKTLVQDAKTSTEIKDSHITKWTKILKKYGVTGDSSTPSD